MEDLRHLCPWVVSATHDVGDRQSLLCVCLSFSAFCLEGTHSAQSLGLHSCCVYGVRADWSGVAYFRPAVPLFCPVSTLCIHSIRQSLYPHHRFCKEVYCKKVITEKEKIHNRCRCLTSQGEGEKILSHRESRIARLSSIALSGCCCSCCNSLVTKFPSRLATMRVCLSQAKRRPFGQGTG